MLCPPTTICAPAPGPACAMLIICGPEDALAVFWKPTRLPDGLITIGAAAIEIGVGAVSGPVGFFNRILLPGGGKLAVPVAVEGTRGRGPRERTGPA